ncbi:hypothetical protein [Mycolicibacter kumamotonensis]|jgi:hypothetical protein|uniref:PEP-CTERM sorting domain-containing protein n=1 Tax=Mycolicibacter kumamotonensis TaxID=354243 RepID=A0A1B8SH86_9MYCO|nr:hypothetical protein [Mycolicibacter kumamotonensis]NDJ91805.1 hypothetical protein [Mycolicibacter kumamotonensis]OBY32085.1 hypothetical protein ACT18_08935 [Mycolicibacter kumamotonensis]
MKFRALGVAVGGAAAAAFLAAGTANADTAETPAPTWTPVYQIDTAEVLQQANSFINTWAVGSTFVNADTTLVGTTYLTPSTGGLNTLFIDEATKDVYNQNQLGLGFTNLYYDAAGDGKDVVDILKTPFGNIDMSSMASLFAPADVSTLIEVSPEKALESAGLYSALNLAYGKDLPENLTWTPVYGTDDAQLLVDQDPFSQTWKLNATFVPSEGDTLVGTNYLTESLFGAGINDVFVTDDGDVYAQNQLGFGFTNLYYNAAGDDTAAVDFLKTPFGNIDMSWAASWFAPADYSDVDVITPDADLAAAGLYSALDLGLPTPDA